MTFQLKPKPQKERKAAVWSLCLPIAVDAELAKVAKKNNLTKSALVRQMVEHCLKEAR